MGVQGIVPAVPPVSGLDRWLLLALPLLLAAEFAGSRCRSASFRRLLRLAAVAVAVQVILYGSIHFRAAPAVQLLPGLTLGGLVTVMAAGGVMAAVTELCDGSAGAATSVQAILVILTLQAGAATVMLGGWISGGAAALPLAGSCLGMVIASLGLRSPLAVGLVIRWGVRSLCGVVLLGHFFGRLTFLQSLMLLSAAVTTLCLPLPKRRVSARLHVRVRCVLGVLLLALVLIPAIAQFIERMRPLLSAAPVIRSNESAWLIDDEAGEQGDGWA